VQRFQEKIKKGEMITKTIAEKGEQNIITEMMT
jgi:hypothetical protein